MNTSQPVSFMFPAPLGRWLRLAVPSNALSAFCLRAVLRTLLMAHWQKLESDKPKSVPESDKPKSVEVFRRGFLRGVLAGAERRPDHLCPDDAQEPYQDPPASEGEDWDYAECESAALTKEHGGLIPPIGNKLPEMPTPEMDHDFGGEADSEEFKLVTLRWRPGFVADFNDSVHRGRRSHFVVAAVTTELRAAGLEDEEIRLTAQNWRVWVQGLESGYDTGLSLRPTERLGPEHTEDLVNRILCAVARRVDDAMPSDGGRAWIEKAKGATTS